MGEILVFSWVSSDKEMIIFVHILVFSKGWQVRDCDPLVELLEAWKLLLPPWILGNILDQLVMPRLQQEVDNWNPLTDTVPIHAWLHPWLPLLGMMSSQIICKTPCHPGSPEFYSSQTNRF